MDKVDFTNKVVILTGSSSGIGAETARAFARYGAQLTLVGRNVERLGHVAEKCETINGHRPLCMQLDLTQSGNCELLITRTVETYGRIDVLINCAGQAKLATVFDKDMKTFDDMMAINLRVPYELTQLAIPHLSKTNGSIVNVGTSFCNRYCKGLIPYILSKTALQRYSEHVAVEVASQGVRVNCVNPGVTNTNIMQNISARNQCKSLLNIMENNSNYIIDPKEIATFICLTASGIVPSLSGSGMHIDGAMSLF